MLFYVIFFHEFAMNSGVLARICGYESFSSVMLSPLATFAICQNSTQHVKVCAKIMAKQHVIIFLWFHSRENSSCSKFVKALPKAFNIVFYVNIISKKTCYALCLFRYIKNSSLKDYVYWEGSGTFWE